MADLPEITSIQRLTVKPGDGLIVRAVEKLNPETAAMLRDVICVELDLPDGVGVVILDGGMSVEVVEAGG